MRKTSKFMRTRLAQGKIEAGYVVMKRNAWLSAIRFSRGYNDDSIVGEPASNTVADTAVKHANAALQGMIDRTIASADTAPHDLLAHCIGVTQIRVLDMGGVDANNVMQRLNLAVLSLLRTRQRWERTGQWGLDGPAITDLRDAMEIYEVILRGSSPHLMEQAQMVRLDRVKQMQGVAA